MDPPYTSAIWVSPFLIIYLALYTYSTLYLYLSHSQRAVMDHICSQTLDAHPVAVFLRAAHSLDRDRHCYCPCLGAISSTKGNHLLCSYKQITHRRVSGGIFHFYHPEAHQGCHSITWKGLQLLWGTSSPAIIPISHPSLFCSVPGYKLQVLPTLLLIHT